MNIAHVTYSTLGGAGRVAQRLSKYQQQLSYSSTLISVTDGNISTKPLERPALTGRAILDKYLVQKHPEDTLFSKYRKNYSALSNLSLNTFDVINLHWIEGVISRSQLFEIKKHKPSIKLFWTLHDMAAFTGGCHHAHNCVKFRSNCSECPQVKGIFQNSVCKDLISSSNLSEFYESIAFIAPSKWMAETASSSFLLKNSHIEIIENPVEDIFFNSATKSQARKVLDIPESSTVGIFIAADLEDPNKQIRSGIQTFLKATMERKNSYLLLVGKNGDKFQDPDSNIRWLGELTPTELSKVGAAADYLSVLSKAETAPLVIAEFAAMGVPAFTLGDTGASSMIDNKKTGFTFDTEEDYFLWLRSIHADSYQLEMISTITKQFAFEKYNPVSVAEKYIKAYQNNVK